MKSVSEIPKEGKSVIVVADIDEVLRFRVFNASGRMILDTDERELTKRAVKTEVLQKQLKELRTRLDSLWTTQELDAAENGQVVQNIRSALGRALEVAEGGKPQSAVIGLASVFRANIPQVFLDLDRTACMRKGVNMGDVFMTLQAYLGSLYVNDFNRFGRTWQVIVQAMAKYRDQKDDINQAASPQQGRNDGAPGRGGVGAGDQRAAGADSLQHVRGGVDQRQCGARGQLRAAPFTRWNSFPIASFPSR